MKLLELWKLYEADKRILGYSPHILKAYFLQLKVLIREIGNLHLAKNPALKLREPNMEKRIPKFLIEEDVIHLKITCTDPREHALLEFLYCTGCRVGEVHKLNIEDINWENCSAIVNGKGSKQREVYFTTECKIWLKRYIQSRMDSCKALFVTECLPARRLSIPTIRYSLKKLAKRGEISANVYPHRFRQYVECW